MKLSKLKDKDLSTEEKILQAAEEEFVGKGFSAAKMPDIAKRAGINHALLHYYFRNKENLFETVFNKKLDLLLNNIAGSFNLKLSFVENIKQIIEQHYDFISANKSLPLFIINEFIRNPERGEKIAFQLKGKTFPLFEALQEKLNEEIAKKNIRPISLFDLILSITSLNIFPFIINPIIQGFSSGNTKEWEKVLEKRKEENVKCILNSLFCQTF